VQKIRRLTAEHAENILHFLCGLSDLCG